MSERRPCNKCKNMQDACNSYCVFCGELLIPAPDELVGDTQLAMHRTRWEQVPGGACGALGHFIQFDLGDSDDVHCAHCGMQLHATLVELREDVLDELIEQRDEFYAEHAGWSGTPLVAHREVV